MKDNAGIISGIIGLLIFCIATLLPGYTGQTILFLIGALVLTLSSYLSRNLFFTILESIVAIGALLTLLQLDSTFSSLVTALLVIATIIYFARQGLLKDKNLYNGIIGLIFIAIGVVLSLPAALVISGVFLSIYAYIIFRRGESIGMIFFILNIIYTITSLIGAINA